jgi:hypothetical protein
MSVFAVIDTILTNSPSFQSWATHCYLPAVYWYWSLRRWMDWIRLFQGSSRHSGRMEGSCESTYYSRQIVLMDPAGFANVSRCPTCLLDIPVPRIPKVRSISDVQQTSQLIVQVAHDKRQTRGCSEVSRSSPFTRQHQRPIRTRGIPGDAL